MVKLTRTDAFKRDYKKLPDDIRKKLNKQLERFVEDPFYPSLRSKPINNTPGVYESSINKQWRFTWKFDGEGGVILRRCGDHDFTINHP